MSDSTEILKAVRDIPFQKIRDSPTVKYYTDWKIYESLLELEYPQDYSWDVDAVKFDPDIILFYDRAEIVRDRVSIKVLTNDFKSESNIYRETDRYSNKMIAYHKLRNKYILKLVLDGGEQDYTIVSPSPTGYLPNHIIIDVEGGSPTTLNLVDLGTLQGLKTLFMEVNVGSNAKLDINYLFIHGDETAVYNDFIMYVDESAELNLKFLGFGGLMTHLRSEVELIGRESRGYTYGSLIARDGTKTDVITNVTHHGDESDSQLSVRGGVLNNGYLVHRGSARILNKSHEASTAVKSYLTIFGSNGKAYSIPMLEVDTGIVAGASHSTSVSRLDEYRIFYLKKMGLSETEIVDMLLRAYVEYSGVAEVFDVDWRSLIK